MAHKDWNSLEKMWKEKIEKSKSCFQKVITERKISLILPSLFGSVHCMLHKPLGQSTWCHVGKEQRSLWCILDPFPEKVCGSVHLESGGSLPPPWSMTKHFSDTWHMHTLVNMWTNAHLKKTNIWHHLNSCLGEDVENVPFGASAAETNTAYSKHTTKDLRWTIFWVWVVCIRPSTSTKEA